MWSSWTLYEYRIALWEVWEVLCEMQAGGGGFVLTDVGEAIPPRLVRRSVATLSAQMNSHRTLLRVRGSCRPLDDDRSRNNANLRQSTSNPRKQ